MAAIGEGELTTNIPLESWLEGKTLQKPYYEAETDTWTEGKTLINPNLDTENDSEADGTMVYIDEDSVEPTSRLAKGIRKFAITRLPNNYKSLWTSSDPNVLFLGASDCDTFSLANREGGVEVTISMGMDFQSISCGLELSRTERKYLVIAVDSINRCRRVIFLELSPTLETVTNTSEIETLYPKCVFEIDEDNIGILCLSPDRIEIYSKPDITFSKAILLDLQNPIPMTSRISVCKSKHGYFVSDSKNGLVHIFDHTVGLEETVGSPANDAYENIPGNLCDPTSVFEDIEGGLVSVCVDGSMHRYNSGHWELKVKARAGDDFVYDTAVIEDNLYTVCKNRLSVYKIKR